MVEYSPTLSRTFLAISDPTRRDILARLESGEAAVTEIAALYAMSLTAVSKHIRVLESAGLIYRRIEGRVHWLSIDREPLADAAAWLTHHARFAQDRRESLPSLRQKKSQRTRR